MQDEIRRRTRDTKKEKSLTGAIGPSESPNEGSGTQVYWLLYEQMKTERTLFLFGFHVSVVVIRGIVLEMQKK